MTEPMVTDEDREIARRWLSEGQINVDQMGRAAVLVAIRQEYLAALAEQDAEIERLRAALEKAKEKLELYRIKNSGKYVGGMEYGALMNLINDLLGKRDECKHDFQVCLLPEGGAMGQCRKCGVIQKTDRSFPILGID